MLDQSVCDLCGAKWHCDKVLVSGCFSFTPLVSSHYCRILIYASVTGAMWSYQLTASLNISTSATTFDLGVVRRFVPVRLRTKCRRDILPFWCHYSATCHIVRRCIRGHRRGDLVSNKTVTRARTDDLERWRQQLDKKDNRTMKIEGGKSVWTISESRAIGMPDGLTLQGC